MLGLRMLDLNSDRRLTTPNALDPIVVTKNPQRLGDRLIKGARQIHVILHAKRLSAAARCRPGQKPAHRGTADAETA